MAASGLAFGKLDPATMIPSGFLGALVGGFIAGGVIILLRKLLTVLPKSLDGIKAILIFPLLGHSLQDCSCFSSIFRWQQSIQAFQTS